MINPEDYEKALRRKRQLNRSFEFTSQNISKLITLNEQLTACEKELLEQSSYLEQKLLVDPKLKGFLSDYEIECRIELYLPDSLFPNEETDEYLCIDSRSDVMRDYSFNGKQLKGDELAFYKTNWNEHFTHEAFQNVRFCYAFHHLVDHTPMTFRDLVQIERVWGEVEVKYQKCIWLSLSPD